MEKRVDNDEIDVIQIIKLIWGQWRTLAKITGFFICIGLLIAFTSKVEYKAICKLLPENQSAGLSQASGLSGLAGLAGMNLSGLSGGDNVLVPELYPEILRSTPFLLELIEKPVVFEKKDTITSSFIYLRDLESKSLIEVIQSYTIGLPWKVKEFINDTEKNKSIKLDIERLTKEEWQVIQRFSQKISVNIDNKTMMLTIKFEFSDPVAASIILDAIVEELKSRIFEYKIEKARENLDFIQERFAESKNAYLRAQKKVAEFINNNQNITNSLVQVELDGLRNEMNIAFEVYSSLASQLEQAKIKVQEDSPVFTTLEPVRIPEDKSRPRRGFILILFATFGLIFAVGFVLLKLNFGH